MSSKLELKNVSKSFLKGTPDEKKVLNNLSLTVNAGDFITILGSNGAGKSTLFNAILGTFLTDTGKIILDGEDFTFMKQHKRAYSIGCLSQNPLKSTAPDMTIEENLALAYTRRASHSFFAVNKRDSAFFREALAELNMGLEDRMKTKMSQLSGGQRQAASLIMATIARPKLLLLDEHTAALDPSAAEKVLKITREVVLRDKITTLMITHDMKYALDYGNRTIMMDGGKIILDVDGEKREQMTPDELIQSFKSKSAGQLDDKTLLS